MKKPTRRTPSRRPTAGAATAGEPRGRALVVGASGFLGSNVARTLCGQGRDVRVLIRKTSKTTAIDDLRVERCLGDVNDRESLERAMAGCESVFYGAVDTRMWLRDTSVLFRTNVEGLANAAEAALAVGIRRFVFTSSIATVGLNPIRPASEEDAFNYADWAPDYVLSRVRAEDALFEYQRARGLPAIACCVANTYGPGDVAPTPHGFLVKMAARGRLKYALDCGAPGVDVRDAAQALVLAEQRGRIGERYIIAGEYLTQMQLYACAAEAGGSPPPARKLPMPVVYGMAWINQWTSRMKGKEARLCPESVLLSEAFKAFDTSKARTELGWQPRPLAESVRDAVAWWNAQREPVRTRSASVSRRQNRL